MGNAKPARGEGWPHTPLSPAVTSPRLRQTELSTVLWDVSGHCHLHVGSSQQQERLSCPVCSSSQAGPDIPSLQGISSHSRPLWCAQQEEDPWQPLWVPQRCGANKEVPGSAGLEMAMKKHPPGIHSCFFPLLPLLKHFVPGSSQPCRAQSGRMVHGRWVLLQGDVGSSPLPCRVHLSRCCSSLGSWGSCAALAQGKGGTGK